MDDDPLIVVDHDICMRCGACGGSCPANAVSLWRTVRIDNGSCTGCGICAEECPTKEKSIVMVKEEVKLAEGGTE